MGVVLSSLVLTPLGATAQENDQGKACFLAAGRFYDDLEYEHALEELGCARRFSKHAEDTVRISLLEGIILADMGRTEESDAAFKTALSLQPDEQLPLAVSPKVEQRFEELRQQVKGELEAQRQLAAKPVEPLPPAPVAAVQPPPAPPEPATVVPQAMPVMPAPQVAASRPGSSDVAWIPAIAGGALLAGGGLSYALSRLERTALRSDVASLATLEDAKNSASRGRTYQAVGLGLAGAGVVGLGVSLGLYLTAKPSGAGEGSLALGTDGTSAFISGRLP
ncbi:hypothetical protein JYJ95_30055 [Corallococcus exiguus]|uniref:hypothetical protein n=1 Tax=Corallococcus exiguus TaxID=83462 RepID=UPI001A8F5B5F|nr:hypothetical protein [Corallococcus exiguus]MBN8470771.1 hypothetical protein [Corallococcus exiguus]